MFATFFFSTLYTIAKICMSAICVPTVYTITKVCLPLVFQKCTPLLKVCLPVLFQQCTPLLRYVCHLCSNSVHHYQDMFATRVPTVYTITKICFPFVFQHFTPLPRYVCHLCSNSVHHYVCHLCSNSVHHYVCHLCSNTVHHYVCHLCSNTVHHYHGMFATCVPALADSSRTKIPVSQTVVRAETLWGLQSANLHKETRGISS